MTESTYNLLFALEKAALAFADAIMDAKNFEPEPRVTLEQAEAIAQAGQEPVPKVVVTAPVSPRQAEPIQTSQPQPQVSQNPPRPAETAIQQQTAQVQTPEPAQPPLNLGQVQTFLATLARGQQREGQQKIADIVYSFGSQRVSDIPSEKLPELVAKVKAEFPNA